MRGVPVGRGLVEPCEREAQTVPGRDATWTKRAARCWGAAILARITLRGARRGRRVSRPPSDPKRPATGSIHDPSPNTVARWAEGPVVGLRLVHHAERRRNSLNTAIPRVGGHLNAKAERVRDQHESRLKPKRNLHGFRKHVEIRPENFRLGREYHTIRLRPEGKGGTHENRRTRRSHSALASPQPLSQTATLSTWVADLQVTKAYPWIGIWKCRLQAVPIHRGCNVNVSGRLRGFRMRFSTDQ